MLIFPIARRSVVDGVRHLDESKGNFMVREMEYLAQATSHE
jgi:hypothetical protein